VRFEPARLWRFPSQKLPFFSFVNKEPTETHLLIDKMTVNRTVSLDHAPQEDFVQAPRSKRYEGLDENEFDANEDQY